jgi:AraC-like DNA-binding protein
MVSHYWVSPKAAVNVYPALPDGAIDLVFQVHDTRTESWVYGTPTTRINILLQQNCDYFGIRFKPGQSRHFIWPSARDLTDTCLVAHEALKCSLNRLYDHRWADVAQLFDTMLTNYLSQCPPTFHRIDECIRLIETTRGAIQISQVAEVFGQSRRQFERVFLETVGISAKTFAQIIRFQHTAKLLASPFRLSLSQIAAELAYADQSHMSHDFKRLAGITPRQFAHNPAAFLQDFCFGSDQY